jgi:hypothetical protein
VLYITFTFTTTDVVVLVDTFYVIGKSILLSVVRARPMFRTLVNTFNILCYRGGAALSRMWSPRPADTTRPFPARTMATVTVAVMAVCVGARATAAATAPRLDRCCTMLVRRCRVSESLSRYIEPTVFTASSVRAPPPVYRALEYAHCYYTPWSNWWRTAVAGFIVIAFIFIFFDRSFRFPYENYFTSSHLVFFFFWKSIFLLLSITYPGAGSILFNI